MTLFSQGKFPMVWCLKLCGCPDQYEVSEKRDFTLLNPSQHTKWPFIQLNKPHHHHNTFYWYNSPNGKAHKTHIKTRKYSKENRHGKIFMIIWQVSCVFHFVYIASSKILRNEVTDREQLEWHYRLFRIFFKISFAWVIIKRTF